MSARLNRRGKADAMNGEDIRLGALRAEAQSLHQRIILAMSNKTYMGNHRNEKATQLWRLLLKTGQRWVRRQMNEWNHWQCLEDEAERQHDLRMREIEQRNAETKAKNEAIHKEWTATFDRHVIQPSYQYDHVVFYHEDYDGNTIWYEAVHFRSEGSVDKTACGEFIAPGWFNKTEEGVDLQKPQPLVVDKSWRHRSCKRCTSIVGPFRVPDRVLTARTKARRDYAVA